MAGHFAGQTIVDDETVTVKDGVAFVRARLTRLEGREKKPLAFFSNGAEGISGFDRI